MVSNLAIAMLNMIMYSSSTNRSSVVSSIREPEMDILSLLTAIQIIDARIQTYWSNLPDELRLNDRNPPSKVDMDAFQGILLLNIVYHQCLCALHSSIVPLFSCSKGDLDGAYARQLSAQVALDHASDISSLLRATLEISWDFNKMPSFLGYAAYCACAIQMPFLWCARPEVKQQAHMNVVTNLNVILIIGKIWKFVQLLVFSLFLLKGLALIPQGHACKTSVRGPCPSTIEHPG